jgi:hypothetical protein
MAHDQVSETTTSCHSAAGFASGEASTSGSTSLHVDDPPCVANFQFIMGNHLNKGQRDRILGLLLQYEDVFAFSMKDLGKCNIMKFSINLTNETPIY